MTDSNKRDLSISMLRANVVAFCIGFPMAILQLGIYGLLRSPKGMWISWNILLFIGLIIISIFVHEFIHGITWMVLIRKSTSTIKLGVQWKTLTPFAHITGPVEVNAYRIGGLMPGLVLGIIPYLLSLALGNSNLLWFGVIHTIAASGDWLLLWILRKVKGGTLVEDHPSRVGCYVIDG